MNGRRSLRRRRSHTGKFIAQYLLVTETDLVFHSVLPVISARVEVTVPVWKSRLFSLNKQGTESFSAAFSVIGLMFYRAF